MNIKRFDELETILGTTRNGFEFEPLIEAVANNDNSRIAGCIYRLLFSGKPSDREAQIEALLEAFDDYFEDRRLDMKDAYATDFDEDKAALKRHMEAA